MPDLHAWNRNRLYRDNVWDTRIIVVLHTNKGLQGLGEFTGTTNPILEQDLEKLRGTNPCRWLAHPELNIWLAPAIYDLVSKANDVPD